MPTCRRLLAWKSSTRALQDIQEAPRPPPKRLQDAPKTHQDAPDTPPRRSQDAPRRPQDASKTAQEVPKTPQERLRTSQDAPKTPKTSQDALQAAPELDFGTIIRRFWWNFKEFWARFCDTGISIYTCIHGQPVNGFTWLAQAPEQVAARIFKEFAMQALLYHMNLDVYLICT